MLPYLILQFRIQEKLGKRFIAMKLSKLSIIMGALFASSLLFGNVQLFHNGMMDMQVAFSTGVSANGLPIASYKEIKYLISARYDNDLYVKVNLNLQPTAASPNFTDLVEYGYIQAGNWRVGKQIVPFGSYNSNIISHTFTREVERLLRQGVTYHMNYFDVFKVYFSLFNDSLNESMTAGALKMYVVPRKEIVFSQSVLFDQEYQTGTTIKQTKLDIHAMANLDFKEAVIDMEFIRTLLGIWMVGCSLILQ
jgi:hypothetical protein